MRNEVPSTVSIFESLEILRRRPAMYIGESSITRLSAFLDGFTFLGVEGKILLKKETPDFNEFSNWIAGKYSCLGTSAGWAHIILQQCSGDEVAAYHLFFGDLAEFKALDPEETIPGPGSVLRD